MRVGEVAGGLSVISGVPDIDYLDALSFPEYLHEFKKVANDPQVAKELAANTLPLLSAEWKVEPASDDPADVEIAELVAANLLGETGETFGRLYWQKVGWRARLRDILRFLQNGFSMFQKVYRLEGRYWVFDKIKYLVPESIEQFRFDEKDELLYVLRTYVNATGKMVVRERVEAADLIVYTWDQEGSNILGKPLIRPMWGPYRMKTILEKLEVVDKQKTAVGIPFFQHAEQFSPEDEKRAEDLLKSMRSGNLEKIYAAIKHGQDFGWKEGGTSTKGIREIIAGKEDQMAKVGGTTASELDNAHSGWSGTSGAKTAIESGLHTAVADIVSEQEQRLVVELVDMNFEGVEDYPRIIVSRIDPFEKTRNIPEFVTAIGQGAVTADLDTENEIRRRYGFMERAEGSEPPPGRRPPGLALARRRGRGGRGPAGSGRSDDAVARAKIDPEKIRERLVGFELQYLETLRTVLDDMRSAVVEAIAVGVEPKKPADVKVPFQSDLKERLLAILKNVRDFGREQLRGEIESQLKASRVRLQSDPTTRAGAIAYANERAQVLVEINVSSLVQRLQTQVTERYNQLAGQGLTTEELIAELQRSIDETSERQIEQMARSSTATEFNEGRNVAVQELKPQLEDVVIRTAVMDERTCTMSGPQDVERCWELDGRRVEIDSADYRKFMPPAFCLGGHQCRCMYVVFPKGG